MGKLINIKEYQKPKVIQGYRMSFYNEKEIDLALLCLNVYGFSYKKYDSEQGYNSKLYLSKRLQVWARSPYPQSGRPRLGELRVVTYKFIVAMNLLQ